MVVCTSLHSYDTRPEYFLFVCRAVTLCLDACTHWSAEAKLLAFAYTSAGGTFNYLQCGRILRLVNSAGARVLIRRCSCDRRSVADFPRLYYVVLHCSLGFHNPCTGLLRVHVDVGYTTGILPVIGRLWSYYLMALYKYACYYYYYYYYYY